MESIVYLHRFGHDIALANALSTADSKSGTLQKGYSVVLIETSIGVQNPLWNGHSTGLKTIQPNVIQQIYNTRSIQLLDVLSSDAVTANRIDGDSLESW